MTREQIKEISNDKGWSVHFSEQGDDIVVEFETYTSFGQDFIVPIVVKSLDDVQEELQNYYDAFDVDEQTSLWIGPDGHGKNGAPYHISDIVKDMEEAEVMIEDLAIALAQV